MDITPTRNLVARAIKSAGDGNVRTYLVESARSALRVNECTLRNQFRQMVSLSPGHDSTSEAHRLCRDLNGYYRTRYSIEKLVLLVPIICDAISSRHWWHTAPPAISSVRDSERDDAVSIVPMILGEADAAGLGRPYSLVTKFLHFCFPDAFGIYDAQAATSIQTWSYFSFALGDPVSRQFSITHMANPNGAGYKAIAGFYKLCWKYGTDQQLADLETAAQSLSRDIGAPVSSLYVIDNLIWHANGDPRVLGLL